MKFTPPERLNKTYIFPSVYGFAFGLLIILMLSMAFIYMNNLIYGAVFFVVSLSIQNMVRTAKNVESVQVEAKQRGPLYANETGEIDLRVRSSKLDKIHFIDFIHSYFVDQKISLETSSKIKIENHKASIRPSRRGELKLGKTEIQSDFPFGFFKSWKFVDISEPLLVYPEKKGEPLFNRFKIQIKGTDNDDFQHHEEFQNNSSLSRVDWKVYSRTQELYVRKYLEEGNQNIELKWDDLQHIPSVEDRLSQLSLWISECYQHNLEFSLYLPHKIFTKNKGSFHFHESMKELALWKTS